MAYAALVLLLFFSKTLAATEVIQNSGVFTNNGAIWYKAGVGENWQKLVGSNVKLTLEPTFPTSKGNFPAIIEKNLPVDLAGNRLGKAATSLLKTLPAIGTAITLAELACDLAQICWNNNSGGFEYQPSGLYPGESGSCEEAVGYPSGQTFGNCTSLTTQHGTLRWFRAPHNPPGNGCQGISTISFIYSATGYKNCGQLESTPRIPTEQDWTNAEPKLNVDGAITPLVTSGGNLPLSAVPSFPPVSKPVATTTTTLKDGAGNVTGTQTSTTTMNVSSTNTVNNYNVTETTITNTYNNSGQLTGSSTTAGDTPPKTPDTKPPIIEFDQVPASDLQTVEVPGTFQPSTWGGGTCPSDTTVNYKHGQLTFKMQPACDFASGIRPVTLVLSALIAAYLISGVRID